MPKKCMPTLWNPVTLPDMRSLKTVLSVRGCGRVWKLISLHFCCARKGQRMSRKTTIVLSSMFHLVCELSYDLCFQFYHIIGCSAKFKMNLFLLIKTILFSFARKSYYYVHYDFSVSDSLPLPLILLPPKHALFWLFYILIIEMVGGI